MEEIVYKQVQSAIKRILNIDLTNYKDEQMKRRLDSWLVRSRMDNWPEYFKFISNDPEALERFRNYLTINVTEFFRDPERWNIIRQEVIPNLCVQSGSVLSSYLKIWSAGCSIGTEPYSLAIMLDEYFPNQKYSILATDLDRGALKKAVARGPYSKEDLRNISASQIQRFFTITSPHYVKKSLQKFIRFQEQDLFADRFESGFDLIVCRNVVIYFTAEAKSILYKKFHAALRPGGILFLGGTEMISGPKDFGFQNFGISLYKKS